MQTLQSNAAIMFNHVLLTNALICILETRAVRINKDMVEAFVHGRMFRYLKMRRRPVELPREVVEEWAGDYFKKTITAEQVQRKMIIRNDHNNGRLVNADHKHQYDS